MTDAAWLVVCALLGWLLWRIARRAVRDFREMRQNNREAVEIFRSLISTPHVHRNWQAPDRTWMEVEETIEVGGLRLRRWEKPGEVERKHFVAGDGCDQTHPGAAHVRCGQCFGTAFRLSFGDYSVVATCTGCGLLDEVYSG